jgi:hypothetical protein
MTTIKRTAVKNGRVKTKNSEIAEPRELPKKFFDFKMVSY